uniref:HDC15785 n=1 Tax=Drosophila melanogaster TaxID=7227 RepID=Q6IJ68_DROME|nr:TPA_inf: HDC15785 [Drosophila melanogaster]
MAKGTGRNNQRKDKPRSKCIVQFRAMCARISHDEFAIHGSRKPSRRTHTHTVKSAHTPQKGYTITLNECRQPAGHRSGIQAAFTCNRTLPLIQTATGRAAELATISTSDVLGKW